MSMTGRYLRVDPGVVARILAEPSSLLDVLYPDPEPADYLARYLDVDKAWHIIHFLLNGDPWEGTGAVGGAVLGGTELSYEDLGYGPARYLTPGEVRQTADALNDISFDQLWAEYDAARAREAELYWTDSPDCRDYVRENYTALQSFYRTASRHGQAVILWLA
jgi:hypothetical protein